MGAPDHLQLPRQRSPLIKGLSLLLGYNSLLYSYFLRVAVSGRFTSFCTAGIFDSVRLFSIGCRCTHSRVVA